MSEELEKKVAQSIRLLKAVKANQLFPDEPIEVAYSGGKDSDVALHLAKAAGINAMPVYKCTTIDPPGIIKHVESVGALKLTPKRTFWKIIEAKGFPSRFNRFCCSELKEFKYSDTTIMGVRKDESVKRAKRYKEPIECRVYKNGGRVNAVYPLLEWTDRDIEEYITENNIKCAPVYYDENGNFDVTKRLGCMCCPLQSRGKRIEEFKKHPKFVQQYLKHGEIFLKTHKHTKEAQKFPTAAHLFIMNVFCNDWEEYLEMTEEKDPYEFLSDYFNIKLC